MLAGILLLFVGFELGFALHETPDESCPAQCKPGEFVTPANTCAQLVQLNQRCDKGKICEPAYAACTAGRCRCLPGFSQINGHCYARKFSCSGTRQTTHARSCVINANHCADGAGSVAPHFGARCLSETFDLPEEGERNKRKKRHTQGTIPFKWNGGCPLGEYCHIDEGYLIKSCHAYAVGHCCPHACPVGDPHPSASCESEASFKCDTVPGFSCYRSFLTPGAFQAFGELIDEFFPKTCCPRHCPPMFVTTDIGHCYPPAKGLDHACWRDEQCFNRKCTQAQCQCESPLKRAVYPFGGEACVASNSTKRLGDQCDVNNFETCGPERSKCFNGVCVCTCGYKADPSGNQCVKKTPCAPDSSTKCKTWAASGECKKNPNWMIKNCPNACGACG